MRKLRLMAGIVETQDSPDSEAEAETDVQAD